MLSSESTNKGGVENEQKEEAVQCRIQGKGGTCSNPERGDGTRAGKSIRSSSGNDQHMEE